MAVSPEGIAGTVARRRILTLMSSMNTNHQKRRFHGFAVVSNEICTRTVSKTIRQRERTQ